MFKLPTLALITVAGLMISTTEAAHAAVLNGSFETGNFIDWTTTGQATVETSSFGVTPPQGEGDYQALLQTCIIDGGCDEASRLPSATDLESFLTLSSGTLTNLSVTEGSAIKQEITANAGDVLTFSWNFLTDQDPDQDFNDFAFFTLSNSLTKLADTFSLLLPTSLTTPLAKETGYQSIMIPIAGNYTLGFGVVDVGDDTANSALLVDNIRVTSVAVPEPVSPLGIIIGLGFGVAFTKKR